MIKRYNLENFDEHARTCGSLTPRSVEACHAQGIEPDELLVKTVAWFKEVMTPVDAEIPKYAEKRFLHYEQNRQAKLRLVRQERNNIINASGGPAGTLQGDGFLAQQAENDARLKAEEVNLQKMQDRQMKKLNNMLAFEVQKQQTMSKFQESIDRQKAKEEADRQEKARIAKEKEIQMRIVQEEKKRREAVEAAESHRMAQKAYAAAQRKLELLQEEQERKKKELQQKAQEREIKAVERRRHLQAILAAQAEATRQRAEGMKAKEEERIAYMEEQRLLKKQQADQKAAAKNFMFQRAMQKNEEVLRQKREEFLVKESLAEERRQTFERQREEEKNERARAAAQKEAEIERAKHQSWLKLEQRKQRAYEKEERAQVRRDERARLQAIEDEKKRMLLAQKEVSRREAINNAQSILDQRVDDFLRKRANQTAKQDQANMERAKKLQEQKLQESLLQMDRQEHVTRMRRIKAYQKSQLLKKIALDNERVRMMKGQFAVLANKRADMRALADSQQSVLMANFEKLKKSGKMKYIDADQCDVVKLGLLDGNFSRTLPSRPKPPNTARANGNSTPRRRQSGGSSTPRAVRHHFS
mmetsp:Transcript_32485/g.63566  ORF Transcript_32485/g.63566 Transcript_32485/m.63566 type:complete len:587 (-) Transcript_32485:113-1873(-)